MNKTRRGKNKYFAVPTIPHFRPQVEQLESRRLLATIQWIGSGDGINWDDSRNWSSNSLPGSSDDVVISVAGSPNVTHRTGSTQIKSLVTDELLTLAGGTLNVSGTITLSNVLTLSGGSLADATVSATTGGKVQLTPSGGTFSNVTIASGTVVDATTAPQFSFGGPIANVVGGLRLNGTLNLGSTNGNVAGQLRFKQASQMLSGTGTIVFGRSSGNGLIAEGGGPFSGTETVVLTIGSGITIQGGTGSVSGKYPNDSIIHQGTIQASNGGIISVGGKNWQNQGMITGVAGSTITLIGSTTLASLGNLSSSGAVNLAAILDNSGTSLDLSASRGSWRLAGGTILGGTITSSDGSTLILTPDGGTLAGVTVSASTVIDATQQPPISLNGPTVAIRGGLTLHGTINLGSTNGNVSGQLLFQEANQTFDGTGSVVFGGSSSNGVIAEGASPLSGTNPVTLTIGPGITIQGGTGRVAGKYAEDSVINQGTLRVANGGSVSVGGKNWSNQGTIVGEAGSIITFVGSSTLAAFGNLSSNGVVNIAEELNNVGTTLALTASQGTWRLAGGTILGGTIASTDGSSLVLTPDGGWLSGVTLAAGTVIDGTQKPQFSLGSPSATILGGLTLHGTVNLGAPNGPINGQLLFQQSDQTLSGTGTIVFGSSANNGVFAEGTGPFAGNTPVTLTIGSQITIRGGSGTIGGKGLDDEVINHGTIYSGSRGGVITLRAVGSRGTFDSDGALIAENGGAFLVQGSLDVRPTALVSLAPGSSLTVQSNLMGAVNETPRFTPRGTTVIQGSGTAATPQTLEAMSVDVGSSSAGFTDNFAYGALNIRSYVTLMDQADNSPDSSAEAVYVDSLLVSSGATLNLNGYHLYARTSVISGSVINGSVTPVPDGGYLPFDTPVPGTIATSGQSDEWTIFGWAGRRVSIVVNPGVTGAPAPLSPQLNWARVSLLDSANNVLATASSMSSGQSLALNQVLLPATGAYKVRVSAAPSNANSTGNYLVTAWDTTPRAGFLGFNELITGTIGSVFSTNVWTFTGLASTQVQFQLQATAFDGLNFTLTGPGGFSGFTNLRANSPVITLPSSGTYTLTANGENGAEGNFAFSLNQLSRILLNEGTPFQGTFFGSGQSNLFSLEVNRPGPLTIDLTDLVNDNEFEFVGSLGQVPTRSTFDFGLFGTLSASRTLSFDAQPGTYNFLLYRDLVTTPGSFSFGIYSSKLGLSKVTPARLGNSQAGTITVYGSGFDAQAEFRFIGADGQVYQPTQQQLRTPTLMILTCDLPNWPAGTYDLRVTRNGTSVVQKDALEVTQGGTAKFLARLGTPTSLGRRLGTSLWLEYWNAGEVSMPVPDLQISGTDDPILTLDRSIVRSSFMTSTMPAGFSSTVTLTASGSPSTPALLQPGERFRVPVFYRGLLQPWNESDTTMSLSLSVRRAGEQGFHEIATRTVSLYTIRPTHSMSGPRGVGARNLLAAGDELPFQVTFENPASARVPVQEVIVTTQLDQNLDWSSFRWSGFGFGSNWYNVPDGRRNYQTRINTTIGGRSLEVFVSLDANLETGLITSVLRALDPLTHLPPSVLYGVLPPNDGSGRGEGMVSYLVRPKSGIPTGTEIHSVAQISFDQVRTTATDQVHLQDPGQGVDQTRQLLITLDSAAPTSNVAPLSTYTLGPTIPVAWGGNDDEGGSGIAAYDVLVATDGGPYLPWLENTLLSNATFNGVIGHRYSFQSIAIDRVGNRQSTSAIPQATTIVVDPLSPPQDIRLSANTITENATPGVVVGILSTIDFNPNDQPTFELLNSAEGRFVIVGNELRVSEGSALDYETSTFHVVQVRATNLAGVSLNKSFNVVLTNVNEPPTSIVLSENSVTENATGASIGRLSTSDPDAGDTIQLSVADERFEIVQDELRLKSTARLDFEITPTVNVTITAIDAAGLSLDQVFTIMVKDINERPIVVSLSNTTVLENSSGATIGAITAIDLDAGDSLALSVDDLRFEITDGVLRLVTGASLDFEAENTVHLVVTATDVGGLSLAETISISVRNINEAPTTISLTNSTVPENQSGATIGILGVGDPDANDVMTLVVDDARLDILGGELRLKSGLSLDYEATRVFDVSIRATDIGGLSLSKVFTITVVDLNEPPVATAIIPDQSVTANTRFEYSLPANLFADPDLPSTLTLTVSQRDGTPVPGWIEFDVESGTISGTPTATDVRTWELRVTATDDGTPPLSAPVDFKLTVNRPFNPHPWQNTDLTVDVDGDGTVAPIDALLVINRLNGDGAGRLPERVSTDDSFYDTNGDDFCTPIDALRVINYLNGDRSEGERVAVPTRFANFVRTDFELEALLELLASDDR